MRKIIFFGFLIICLTAMGVYFIPTSFIQSQPKNPLLFYRQLMGVDLPEKMSDFNLQFKVQREWEALFSFKIESREFQTVFQSKPFKKVDSEEKRIFICEKIKLISLSLPEDFYEMEQHQYLDVNKGNIFYLITNKSRTTIYLYIQRF